MRDAAVTGKTETERRPLFRRHVRRPRLTRILDESTAQAIVLNAPAGYGKTTLAAEWLEGRPAVAWYRATSASADVAAFSIGVADALQAVVPGAGGRLRQRMQVTNAPERDVRPLAELLAEDLAEWPRDAWLVIEDYHLMMESEFVEDFIDWLLTLAPIRVLVTTRRRPRWASARRVLYGEITEITRDQLAMTRDEARAVLGDPSPEGVDAVVDSAEGWPALIGLAAVTGSADVPHAHVSAALVRFFAEEVFDHYEPAVQHVLVAASMRRVIHDRASSRASDTDTSGIAQLVEDGLLQRIGSEGFRVHPLVGEFLRAKVRAEDPQLHATLVTEAIAEARAERRWEEAFDTAFEADRRDVAAELAGEAARELLDLGRLETVERWLKLCGDALFRSPALRIARAELALRRARLAEAGMLASDLATGISDDHPFASRAWNVAGRAAHLLSDEAAALERHRRAQRAARTTEEARDAAWGALLAAWELELPDVTRYFDDFAALASDDIDGRLRVWAGAQLCSSLHGPSAELRKNATVLADLIDHSADPLATTNFLSSLAWLAIARAEYETGREVALRAIDVCNALHLDFAVGVCLAHVAAAEIGLRRFREARASIRRLDEIARAQEDPYLRIAHRIVSLKHALATGDPMSWIPHEQAPVGNFARATQAEYIALCAVAAGARGESKRAQDLIRSARSRSRAVEPSLLIQLAALVTDVETGLPDAVVRPRLASLIEGAARAGCFDAIVVAYRACPRILSLFVDPHVHPDAIAALEAAIRGGGDEDAAHNAGIRWMGPTPSRVNNLTPREIEILELVCEGLSNAEIARRLVISRSTAKVHIHRVLQKLGVGSRVEAAVRGRELLDARS